MSNTEDAKREKALYKLFLRLIEQQKGAKKLFSEIIADTSVSSVFQWKHTDNNTYCVKLLVQSEPFDECNDDDECEA